jgi:hypothetical protein
MYGQPSGRLEKGETNIKTNQSSSSARRIFPLMQPANGQPFGKVENGGNK